MHKGLQTRLCLSIAYHPQSGGSTERTNQVIEDILRAHVSLHLHEWEDYLWSTEFAFNSATHSATQLSPFQFITRFSPRTLLTAIVPAQDHVPAAMEFLQTHRQTQLTARQHALETQQRQEHTANRHRREVTFQVGDWVLLSTKNLTLPVGVQKLSDPFTGPYQIAQRIGQVAYRLALPATMRIHPTFHVSLLKPYRGTPPTQPPPDWIDDHPEYEVVEILQHRIVRRQHQLLVFWQGFPLHEATWEPLANLHHAKDIVCDYAWRHHLVLPGFEDEASFPPELCQGKRNRKKRS